MICAQQPHQVAYTRVEPGEPNRVLYIDTGDLPELHAELLLASGAIEAQPQPSVWRGLVNWLCQPCAWGQPS